MSTCCSTPLESHFDRRRVQKLLAGFLRAGPPEETRLLASGLLEAGIAGATVLDVGSGIGALHQELLRGGASRVHAVDASAASIEAAGRLAQERGYADRVDYRTGDAVALAESLPAADVVTLDKVVCCYPDATALTAISAERARRLCGLVYPHDGPLYRAMNAVENGLRSIFGDGFRSYIHPSGLIEGLLHARGFRLRSSARTRLWSIRIFERS